MLGATAHGELVSTTLHGIPPMPAFCRRWHASTKEQGASPALSLRTAHVPLIMSSVPVLSGVTVSNTVSNTVEVNVGSAVDDASPIVLVAVSISVTVSIAKSVKVSVTTSVGIDSDLDVLAEVSFTAVVRPGKSAANANMAVSTGASVVDIAGCANTALTPRAAISNDRDSFMVGREREREALRFRANCSVDECGENR